MNLLSLSVCLILGCTLEASTHDSLPYREEAERAVAVQHSEEMTQEHLHFWSPPSLVLLNDTTEHYHWGCTGTSIALKEELETLGYAIDCVSIHEMRALDDLPNSFDQFEAPEYLEKFVAAHPQIMQRLREADVVIINGEGSMHAERPLPRALLYLAYIAKTALHKHVEIINHSCFPEDRLSVNNPRIKELYHGVYELLDYVSVREPLSYEVMREIGIDVDLGFDCLPLYIQRHYTPKPERKRKQIVLAGSVEWEEKGVERIVGQLQELEAEGYAIEVLVGAKSHPSHDDQLFVDFLQKELRLSWKIIQAGSLEEWLSTIAEATLLISGRFHHTVAAICLKTPFVALNSNTPKIEGMLQIMPTTIEVLKYGDPDLAEKLQEEIQRVLTMASSNFPEIEEICLRALRQFSSLKTYASKR